MMMTVIPQAIQKIKSKHVLLSRQLKFDGAGTFFQNPHVCVGRVLVFHFDKLVCVKLFTIIAITQSSKSKTKQQKNGQKMTFSCAATEGSQLFNADIRLTDAGAAIAVAVVLGKAISICRICRKFKCCGNQSSVQ